MGVGLVICAIVLAICTVIVFLVVHNDLKKQQWSEDNKRNRKNK